MVDTHKAKYRRMYIVGMSLVSDRLEAELIRLAVTYYGVLTRRRPSRGRANTGCACGPGRPCLL